MSFTILAHYDAQFEYAEQDRNGNGILEYAQQFISTESARDGLFWEAEDGEAIAMAMTSYNPDEEWEPVKEVNNP